MDRLKYKLLTKKDIGATIKCMVKTFLYDEPMTRSLKIPEKEFEHFTKLICGKMAEERLSYICKNSFNEVIAFCLNEDLITEPLKGIENITPKMKPILNVLEKLDALYLRDRNRKRKVFFHMFMVGALREYRGRGIVQRLITNSIRSAKSKGFCKILTEATSLKSQNLFIKKFGFDELYKLDYKRFAYNKSRVFENIGEKYCKLLELNI